MRINGTPTASGRDATYSPDEVRIVDDSSGGGDSGIRFATVTVINNSASKDFAMFTRGMPHVADVEGHTVLLPSLGRDPIFHGTTRELIVPLAADGAMWDITDLIDEYRVDVVRSGNAHIIEETVFITGNATLTCSDRDEGGGTE